ncbi:MAG: motility protein A [Planctomycetes bacterium]|nr:motility protein A [Planctomycetota bacterium]
MDIATLIGLLLGLSVVVYGVFSGGNATWFVDYPSLVIVFGGATASTFICFPLASVLSLVRVSKNAFMTKAKDPAEVIRDMVRYAEVARRDGILSLENMTKDISDEFVVKGIQMAVDGIDPELIEQIMTNELDALADRHARGKSILDAMNKYAPAYGMIGTLFGLVVMLRNMDDPSKIGPGMAVAVLTTLYGAVISNLLMGPLSDKIALRSAEEQMVKTIVIRGVMAIQSGDNPRIVEQKLKTFLSPKARRAFEGRAGEKAA